MIFRSWPVRNLTSLMILGTECFFATKFPNRYRYSTKLIITIKTATIQPNNHYPISFIFCYYIKAWGRAGYFNFSLLFDDFLRSCLDPDRQHVPRLLAAPHPRYGSSSRTGLEAVIIRVILNGKAELFDRRSDTLEDYDTLIVIWLLTVR